ncbi:hypothetical protein [Aeromonas taiwanensis]|uniref:hypothetical protein n=1 Tax=Aeromonas taiwanensis TaxID=633417 RepID=UPI00248E61C8|nr:hypothetical protein [Aeromonas taiwanensis]
MDSKLKAPALKMAGWGLLHGDFFDLYDVAEVLEIPSGLAGQLMIYLRTMHSVELVAEVRVGLKEPGRANKRIFIKVLCIHPEPPSKAPAAKQDVLRSKLVQLSKVMPSPRGAR